VQNSTFNRIPRRKFKNYRHKRIRSNATRNSVFSLISKYIDQNKSVSRLNRNIVDDGVYFQIFGMCIITVAVVLAFQGFVRSDSLATSAEQQEKEVRILTNFQYSYTPSNVQSRLQDFSIAPVTATDTPDSTAPNNEATVVETPIKQDVIHVVEDGENVYTIAADYEVNPQEIISLNNLAAPYTIKVGEELVVG